MTALTAPARPEEGGSLPPVPWRRMAWVTWRQQRLALGGVALFLGAVGVCIWRVGLGLHHAYAVAAACRPITSPGCDQLQTSVSGMDGFLANGYVLQAVPALIGAFSGAPLLARELETGTFRYAWTQGIGPSRWTLAKLIPHAVVLAAAAGAFSLLLAWYYQPYLESGNQNPFLPELSPLGDLFALRGVAFAAWTLAAFAIGAFAGLVIRRIVPAIGAALAAYATLAFAAGLYLRQHYLTPLTGRNLFSPPAQAWIISQWWTKRGSTVSAASMHNVINALFYRMMPGVHSAAPKGSDVKAQKQQTMDQINHLLIQRGYTQWTHYQPVTRFWPFQWIEAGWLVTLSVLLLAATVWLVRRR
jgi:hypothetical protein